MSDNYDKMKIADLKSELSKRGLPVSGKKDALIKRLREAKDRDEEGSGGEGEESKNESDDSSEKEEDEEEELPEDITKMKVPDLKKALKKRSLSVSGSKAVLVERLKGFLNGDEVQPEKKATGKRKASDEPEGSVPKKKTASSEKGKDQKSNSDFSEPTLESDELRITTWNVASYNTICSKGYFDEYLKNENPDILCLNETKVGTVPENKYPGYYSYFYESEKPGYSGVAVITKTKPISIQKGIGDKEHDTEGRCITAEYDNFYLVATYIPNAGAKDKGSSMPKDLEYRMEWDKAFQKFLLGLDKKKPIIWCGDLNVAHKEVDLANPSKNKKTAGFTPEERNSFGKFLDTGFVDAHRHFYPNEKGGYTFWPYRSPGARAKNIGWRLDYFVVSKRILPRITQSFIRSQVMGSDHCPIGIHLKKS